MLRKNRPAFAIGEETLGKIRGHDIELYLDVERPYPSMVRGPKYLASLETRKEIEKHINQLLDMDLIRKIGNNVIVEITTPVLITWNDGKYRLCGDLRALISYTKADRYPIPRMPHALEKLEKAKCITKMDFMRGFHQNGVKPNSMKLLRIICHMSIYEYTRISFGIKNEPAHFQRMNDTILQEGGKRQTNADGLSRLPLENFKRNPAYDPEVAAKIPIHLMEIDRRRNFRFSEWEPEISTPDTHLSEPEGTETPILGISSSEIHTKFSNSVMKTYAKHQQCGILLQLLRQKYRSPG
ncbi:hypothetical protein O181_025435 [Austropuccinia psidii MF-1]|uniref:Reverse transcriptase domain-containing protein n=1 Tax=Austropuccinia psidii MF-1 TaxID=1389203 RepID=A0A9Q3CMG3_9BASI|nr:hypothetical protein [Austropuccinia psidii MF-1]